MTTERADELWNHVEYVRRRILQRQGFDSDGFQEEWDAMCAAIRLVERDTARRCAEIAQTWEHIGILSDIEREFGGGK